MAALATHNSSHDNTFYVLRHGQSEANVAGVIVSSDLGVSMYGLSALGAEQAMHAAAEVAKIANSLRKNVVVVSSDFKRARETAESVVSGAQLNCGVSLDQRLRWFWLICAQLIHTWLCFLLFSNNFPWVFFPCLISMNHKKERDILANMTWNRTRYMTKFGKTTRNWVQCTHARGWKVCNLWLTGQYLWFEIFLSHFSHCKIVTVWGGSDFKKKSLRALYSSAVMFGVTECSGNKYTCVCVRVCGGHNNKQQTYHTTRKVNGPSPCLNKWGWVEGWGCPNCVEDRRRLNRFTQPLISAHTHTHTHERKS